MNSPALNTNWQKTAQPDATRLEGSCAGRRSCQHDTHAESKSPFSAMVCRNHYPSPSSTRFSAFASEPGLFSPGASRSHDARRRGSRKFDLGTLCKRGRMTARNHSERGSLTCSTNRLSQGRLPLPCWQDASGTTLNAPVSVRRQVPWSQVQPMAVFSPEPSSAQAQVRCATTWASVSATDLKFSGSADSGSSTHNRPAETFGFGGLFYVNQRDTLPCRALT